LPKNLESNIEVDFSLFATGGQVENFHIIFAGYGDEAIGNGQQIWSHKGTLGSTVIKDGVNLSSYSCSPELRGSFGTNITNIGVVAHEMAHGLGSPDYYDTGSSGYIGSGLWDLMAGGTWNDNGRQPAHINPYQKIQFGWITPRTIAAGSSINNMPASANNRVVYKIAANNNGEHYLLENRQLVGFDASLPGHGLLIWHIAANVGSKPNDNHPQQVYPVCANSTVAIPTNTPNSYGNINSAGCPYPGTNGNNEFTGTSIPRAFTWSGLSSLGNLVTNIIENTDQTISFGPPVILGPSNICGTIAVYNLNSKNQASNWFVTPSNAFNITWNATSATVTSPVLNGQTATLTAVVNGVNITYPLQACNTSILGNSAVCSTAVSYTLSQPALAMWSVEPAYDFTIEADFNSATVKATNLNGQTGTIRTRTAAGATFVKSIQACCSPITYNFTNQTVTTNTTITHCSNGDIYVQDVKVQNGAKLIFETAVEVIIGSDFDVEVGSEFEIRNY